MNNGEQPAFPHQDTIDAEPGLTKREYFAAMAMQGLLASHPDQIHNSHQGTLVALTWADELLKQLEQ